MRIYFTNNMPSKMLKRINVNKHRINIQNCGQKHEMCKASKVLLAHKYFMAGTLFCYRLASCTSTPARLLGLGSKLMPEHETALEHITTVHKHTRTRFKTFQQFLAAIRPLNP